MKENLELNVDLADLTRQLLREKEWYKLDVHKRPQKDEMGVAQF